MSNGEVGSRGLFWQGRQHEIPPSLQGRIPFSMSKSAAANFFFGLPPPRPRPCQNIHTGGRICAKRMLKSVLKRIFTGLDREGPEGPQEPPRPRPVKTPLSSRHQVLRRFLVAFSRFGRGSGHGGYHRREYDFTYTWGTRRLSGRLNLGSAGGKSIRPAEDRTPGGSPDRKSLPGACPACGQRVPAPATPPATIA